MVVAYMHACNNAKYLSRIVCRVCYRHNKTKLSMLYEITNIHIYVFNGYITTKGKGMNYFILVAVREPGTHVWDKSLSRKVNYYVFENHTYTN